MKNRELTIIMILILLSIGSVAGCVGTNHQKDEINFNSSQAIEIVLQDSAAGEYFSENYKREAWRLERALLLNQTDGKIKTQMEYPLWKVEILERTCACSGIRDLFMIEGYVSPKSGERFNVTTGTVMENQYEAEICAGKCHH